VFTLPWGAPLGSSLLLSRLVKIAHPNGSGTSRACCRRILGGRASGVNLRPGGRVLGGIQARSAPQPSLKMVSRAVPETRCLNDELLLVANSFL
jgi:hypothetical protein